MRESCGKGGGRKGKRLKKSGTEMHRQGIGIKKKITTGEPDARTAPQRRHHAHPIR